MITRDQPTCFPDAVSVYVSSKDDGTVLDKAIGVHHPASVANRATFCGQCGMSYGDVVYQRILYDDAQTYDKIVHVDDDDTCQNVDEVHADALITQASGVGLILPVADCIATVLYDPATKQLALAHLGRHSTVANLMAKVITEMVRGGANPRDITIWMAPSVKRSHYVMEYFGCGDELAWQEFVYREPDGIHLDLHGYNRAAAIAAGVLPERVIISPINTAVSEDYFSHSQGDAAGRFAVLAMIRP